MIHLRHNIILGTTEHDFQTSTEFTLWKETIEEESHTYYTKEKEYKPSDGIDAHHIVS